MAKAPDNPHPTLADLRKEIDRIDEAMHQLLMERGEIIDRLIAVKQQPGDRLGVPPGARGRDDAPAGRAPQRHPAARHRREHLARHHLDLHLCAGAVLGARRPVGGRRADARFARASISASRCRSCRTWARPAWSRRCRPRRAISAWCRRSPSPAAGAWWSALEFDAAPKIIARLPFVERADHPAALPVFVISRVAADAMATEVAVWSVRVVRLGRRAPRRRCRRSPISSPCPTAPSTAPRLLVTLPQGVTLDDDQRGAWLRPAPRCARRPSSAATRPAIRLPPTSADPAAATGSERSCAA